MPPRFAYWTIIFGNQPTSFRMATREELLPTYKQILAKHPDAVMMWFAHGRLWKSEEEALEERRRRFGDPGAPPPPRDDRRGRDWRPGGQHKDPRDRFKVPRDVKRARFKERARRDDSDPPPDSGAPRDPQPDSVEGLCDQRSR